MNVLVTGASGFIGTGLCKLLESYGHYVVPLDSKACDLRSSKSIKKFNNAKYNLIFHLAAWTQAGDFCLYHPGEQWIINQRINTNVLDWWHNDQPQAKLIFMGTSCAYDPEEQLREDNYLKGTPIESLFTYAMTKRMLYVGALALQKQFGLNYLCLVPSTVYGPSYHTDGRQMHFIFDLIRKILLGKLVGAPVILWGDGFQSRELVYTEDFVKIAYELALSVNNDVINIGAGEEYTIRYFAKLICEIVDYDFEKIQYDTSRYVGAKSKCLDVAKLKHYLPDLKLTPLSKGLNKTVKWFISNRELLLTKTNDGNL